MTTITNLKILPNNFIDIMTNTTYNVTITGTILSLDRQLIIATVGLTTIGIYDLTFNGAVITDIQPSTHYFKPRFKIQHLLEILVGCLSQHVDTSLIYGNELRSTFIIETVNIISPNEVPEIITGLSDNISVELNGKLRLVSKPDKPFPLLIGEDRYIIELPKSNHLVIIGTRLSNGYMRRVDFIFREPGTVVIPNKIILKDNFIDVISYVVNLGFDVYIYPSKLPDSLKVKLDAILTVKEIGKDKEECAHWWVISTRSLGELSSFDGDTKVLT